MDLISIITRQVCLRCKHTWMPRQDKIPVQCPSCKRIDWNVKKEKKEK